MIRSPSDRQIEGEFRMIAVKSPRLAWLAVAMCSLLSAPASRADFITYTTPSGSTAGGQPVNAQAAITTGNGTVTITLTNLQNNPTSDSQNISGIIFTFSNAPSSVTLASSLGTPRTVNGDKTYSDASATSTIWTVGFSNPTVTLTTLGNSHAPETIIGGPAGDNKYDAANSSIAGSNHNPFLANSATFTLTAPGVTSSTTVATLVFEFSTATGTTVTGVPVPEPSSLALLALGGGGAIGLVARRRLARERAGAGS
jgi:hypothetical protein